MICEKKAETILHMYIFMQRKYADTEDMAGHRKAVSPSESNSYVPVFPYGF